MRKLFSTSAVLLALFPIGQILAMDPPETTASFLARHHVEDSPAGLRAALSNPDSKVRSTAASLLGLKEDVNSIPFIEGALAREPSPAVQITLAGALVQLGDTAGHAWLVNECKQSSVQPAYRMQAAYKALEEGSDDCLGPVLDMLGNKPDPDTASIGVLYLRNSMTPPANSLANLRRKLEATLSDSSKEDSSNASRILAVVGDSASIPLMQKAIEKETDPNYREALENDLQTLKARLHRPS